MLRAEQLDAALRDALAERDAQVRQARAPASIKAHADAAAAADDDDDDDDDDDGDGDEYAGSHRLMMATSAMSPMRAQLARLSSRRYAATDESVTARTPRSVTLRAARAPFTPTASTGHTESSPALIRFLDRGAPDAVGQIQDAQAVAVLPDVAHERVARAHAVHQLQLVHVLGAREHELQTRLADRRAA